jgi:hypothetical protein
VDRVQHNSVDRVQHNSVDRVQHNLLWSNNPNRAQATSLLRSLYHIQLDIHNKQESSERVISSSQRPLPTQHTTNTVENIRALGSIRTRDSSNREAADQRLTAHGHPDRRSLVLLEGFDKHRGF